MAMPSIRSFLSGLNAEKLSLNTLSGSVTTIALLLTIDALAPGEIIESVLSQTDAGPLVLTSLFVIALSAILGLMVDSVFHSFGRWLARQSWLPLKKALQHRTELMESIGLTGLEYEWVKATGEGIPAEDNARFLRFTETAGNTAYGLLLLTPATALYFSSQYGGTSSTWLLTVLPAIAATILLFTSAVSLTKYEIKKTAAAMDEMAKLSTYHPATTGKDSGGNAKEAVNSDDSRFSKVDKWVIGLLIPGIVVIIISVLLIAWMPTQAKEGGMKLIADMKDGEGPTLVFEVTKKGTPANVSKSMTVKIGGDQSNYENLELANGDNNVLSSAIPDGPAWTMKASVGSGGKSDSFNVAKGEYVYINASLLFQKPDGTRLDVNAVGEGDWLFPVVLKDGKDTTYLLAYIKVTIKVEQLAS